MSNKESKESKDFLAIPVFEGFGKDLNRVLFFEVFHNFMFEYTSEQKRATDVERMMSRCRKKHIPVTFKLVNKLEKSEEDTEVSEQL